MYMKWFPQLNGKPRTPQATLMPPPSNGNRSKMVNAIRESIRQSQGCSRRKGILSKMIAPNATRPPSKGSEEWNERHSRRSQENRTGEPRANLQVQGVRSSSSSVLFAVQGSCDLIQQTSFVGRVERHVARSRPFHSFQNIHLGEFCDSPGKESVPTSLPTD